MQCFQFPARPNFSSRPQNFFFHRPASPTKNRKTKEKTYSIQQTLQGKVPFADTEGTRLTRVLDNEKPQSYAWVKKTRTSILWPYHRKQVVLCVLSYVVILGCQYIYKLPIKDAIKSLNSLTLKQKCVFETWKMLRLNFLIVQCYSVRIIYKCNIGQNMFVVLTIDRGSW